MSANPRFQYLPLVSEQMRTAWLKAGLVFVILFSAGAREVRADVAELVGQAEEEFRRDRYEAAILVMQRAVEQYPEEYDAYYFLGEAYLRAGKPRAALAPLEKAKQIRPDVAWADGKLGQAYQALGELRLAAVVLDRALRIPEPDWESLRKKLPEKEYLKVYLASMAHYYNEIETRVRLGEVYLDLGEESKSDSTFKAEKPHLVAVYLRNRIGELRDGAAANKPGKGAIDYRRASKLAIVLVQLEPDKWENHFELGELLVLLADWAPAISELGQALNLQPKLDFRRGRTLHTYAVVLYRQGQYQAAQAALAEAAALEPLFLEHAEIAGVVAFQAGNYGAQIIQQERVLRLDPPRASLVLHNQLGIAHAVRGDYSRAAEVLDAAARKFARDRTIDDWRLVVAYTLGGWDRAVGVWQENHPAPKTYREKEELLWPIYYGLLDLGDRARKAGANYAALGHYSRAQVAIVDLYQRGHFGSDWANGQLTNLFAQLSETYRLLPFKPVLPEAALTRLSTAEAMLRQQKVPPGAVVETYLSALAEAPWSPEIRYNLALTLAADRPHQLPWAIQEMERFVSLVPDDTRVASARQRIALWKATVSKLVNVCDAEVIPRPGTLDALQLSMKVGAGCDSPH